MPLENIRGDKVFNGLAVADVDGDLMEAFLRLMKLLDTPDDIPMPSLITIREIYARILLSPWANTSASCARLARKATKLRAR